MSLNCSCGLRCNCPVAAALVSVLLGVVAAFLQITGTITVTPAFLWVVLGVAIGYLAVFVVATAAARKDGRQQCLCSSLGTLLAGIIGSVLFSVILLAVGIVATSVLSAILVGLTALSFFLTVLSAACLLRYLADCSS